MTHEREAAQQLQGTPEGVARPTATPTSIPCTSAAFAELSAAILGAGSGLRFRAHGDSMAPLLRDGDMLRVDPVEPGSVRVGDVILCCGEPGRILVHRVVRRMAGPDGYLFEIQGDGAARPDGAIPAERVYGRVVAIDRSGGRIRLDSWGQRRLGWALAQCSRRNLGRWSWPIRRLIGLGGQLS